MISADDSELLTKSKTFVIPNFAEEAEMLEWAGISFGKENTLRLQKSIKVSLSGQKHSKFKLTRVFTNVAFGFHVWR